jgi:hypothetical protein
MWGSKITSALTALIIQDHAAGRIRKRRLPPISLRDLESSM